MRILHISDLHFGKDSSNTERDIRKNCLEKLRRKISQISEEKRIDYLVVSSDIANCASESEYNEAYKFFSQLYAESKIYPGNTIIAPGNHDFDRKLGAALSTPSTMEEAAKTYNLESLPGISVPFKEFEKFCEKLCVARPQLTKDTSSYLVGVCKFPGIDFVVLNSAWNKKDGYTWIGKNFLENIEAAHLIDETSYTVTVMHHPLESIESFEQRKYGNGLPTYTTIENLSDLILCGHCHEVEINVNNARTGDGYCIACGASYLGDNYINSFACYDLEAGNLNVQPFYYQNNEWSAGPVQQKAIKKKIDGDKPAIVEKITPGFLHKKLREFEFRIEQCNEGPLGEGGILIWPVVPRKEITIIHQAEIEIMRLLCKRYHWNVFVLISDCGTKARALNNRDITKFKQSIQRLMDKREVPVSEYQHLSYYFKTQDAQKADDILHNFILLSEEMKQKDLADLKNKEYSQKIKESNEQLPVIDYILPLLQLSVVLYLSEKEFASQRSLIVAGADELRQWNYICHRSEKLGSILIPTLMDDKTTGCWQQEVDKYLSEEQIRDNLRKGNFGFWCYTMFVLLQQLSEEDTKHDIAVDSVTLSEWKKDQFNVPKTVDLKKLASSIWNVASMAILD